MDRKDTHQRNSGFTLVEMLISLVVFGILGIVATRFLITQTASMNRTNEVAAAQQNVRAALHRISSDIRLVGHGLNAYNIQVPDMIVPNDGSVSVGTFKDDAVSLISIPDPSDPTNLLALDPGVPNNGDQGSTSVDVTAGSDLTGLAPGERLIFFDPNSGNSQVVTLTQLSGLTLDFTADPLTFDFPAIGLTPTQLLKLNEVRYRLSSSGSVPFIERKINRGPWIRYIEGINRIQFTYFDSAGTQITPTSKAGRRAIRRVEVGVTGSQIRFSKGGERRSFVTLFSSVVPRNMLPTP